MGRCDHQSWERSPLHAIWQDAETTQHHSCDILAKEAKREFNHESRHNSNGGIYQEITGLPSSKGSRSWKSRPDSWTVPTNEDKGPETSNGNKWFLPWLSCYWGRARDIWQKGKVPEDYTVAILMTALWLGSRMYFYRTRNWRWLCIRSATYNWMLQGTILCAVLPAFL